MLKEFAEKWLGSPGFVDDDGERLGGYLDSYKEISGGLQDNVKSRACEEVLEYLMRNSWMKSILQEFQFLKYSGSYWCFHATQATMRIRFDWFGWLVGRNQPILEQWRLLNSIDGGCILDTLTSAEILDLGKVSNNPPDLIEFAAYLGMQNLVSHLLSNYQFLMEPSNHISPKEAAILVASYAGQLDLLRALLQQGIKPFVLNRAVRLAAEKGYEGVVTELLARDAGVPNRAMALIGASTYGHQKVAEMVLDDSPLPESVPCVSLMAACIGGHESIVAIILQHVDLIPAISHDGAIGLIQIFEKQDLDHMLVNYTQCAKEVKGVIEKFRPNGKLWTPLMLASLVGEGKVVSLLLARGGTATFEMQPVVHEHEHALTLASAMGNNEVVTLLLNDAQVNAELTHPMAFACLCNKMEVVQILLDKNKDLLWQDLVYGKTALHLASSKGYEALVKRLLEYSHTAGLAQSKDETGRTPFFVAAENGHANVCRILLEMCDPHLDISDEFQWGILFHAAQNGHVDVVHLLTEFSEPGNSCDHLGRTALSYAAENGHLEIVQLLLRENAESGNSRDLSGRAPLSYAAEKGHFEIVQELVIKSDVGCSSHDLSSRPPLFYAVENGNIEVVQQLLENGADVTAKDNNGETALHVAAYNRHESGHQSGDENGDESEDENEDEDEDESR
jgi:ankyrin repeat protein